MVTGAPGATKARLNDAITALKRGQLSTALSIARDATQKTPEDPDTWWVLSMVCYRMWLLDEAESALAAGAGLLSQDLSKLADFTSRRATLLILLGHNALAAQIARDALTMEGLKAAHIGLFGNVLLSAGYADEAISVLSRAALLDPKMADSWFRLGRAHESIGNIEPAEHFYEKAIAAGQHTGAHLALARLKRWTKSTNHIDRLLKLPAQDSGSISRIQSALFKEYDDLGMVDEAWRALEASNQAALNEILPSVSGIWGAEDEARPIRLCDLTLDREVENIDAWKHHFPVERFAGQSQAHASARETTRRIFIVGLPRTGTTLVQSILAAHSHVQALGEMQTFPVSVKRVSKIQRGGLLNPDIIAFAGQADPQVFADVYDDETTVFNNGKTCTVDKLTQNYEYAGLIRLAFPDAVIIETRRNTMDTLFGAYKLLMGSDHLWTYRLNDLAQHYANYISLMKHWRACVDNIVEVSLEALIANPQEQIRHLLMACNLPFEDACLNPHQAGGAVITSSSVQIRSPINAQGVGAWRKYAAQLAPLRRYLEELDLIDSADLDRGDLPESYLKSGCANS